MGFSALTMKRQIYNLQKILQTGGDGFETNKKNKSNNNIAADWFMLRLIFDENANYCQRLVISAYLWKIK